jgi:hypothetical protein
MVEDKERYVSRNLPEEHRMIGGRHCRILHAESEEVEEPGLRS